MTARPRSHVRILAAIAGLLLVVGARDAAAQFRVAGIYGSETEFGVHAGFYFPVETLNENISFGMGGTFYFPDEKIELARKVQTTYVEGDVNIHYDLFENALARAYGLGGMHYAYTNIEIIEDDIVESDGQFGVNVGAGFQARFVFGELAYSLGGFDQVTATLGITF
jgi:hypothetical protein